MNSYPHGLKYTKKHAWMECAGNYGKVGITDYAQRKVGEIVYVDLPPVGARLERGEPFATIESADAFFELYSPASGQVVGINGALKRNPGAVNVDPHGSWIVVLELGESCELDSLMDAQKYAQHVGTLCEQW